MPENIQLESQNNINTYRNGRHTLVNSINSANNQQRNNHVIYSPNTSSAGSNITSGNKNIDYPLSLSQITESLDDTNSSTQPSQQNITESTHTGDKPSSSSLSSNNDLIDTIHPINNDDIGSDGEVKFSYVKAIAEAIIETPNKEILLNDLYNKIIARYPELKNKRVDWQNGIRHNLSLNECFIKLDRNPSGKGHYWGIRHSNMEAFLRNDFRRQWNQSRTRCRRPKFSSQNEFNYGAEAENRLDRSMLDRFGGNYMENDPLYPTWYNCDSHLPHFHPYHTMPQYPFQMQYLSSRNNDYFIDSYNREYEQLYNKLYSHPLHLDSRNHAWPIHSSRYQCHFYPCLQNFPDPYLHHLSMLHCSQHLNNNIPYCVDENDCLEEWETSNKNTQPKERIKNLTDDSLIDLKSAKKRKADVLIGSNSRQAMSVENIPSLNCASKPIIRSYFSNNDIHNIEIKERTSTSSPVNCNLGKDMTASTFDLNSLLER